MSSALLAASLRASLPRCGELLAGKFRVERLLGNGGMGAVFAARHEVLGQRVAVKVLLEGGADDPVATERFLNEARAAASIDSDHVTRIFDVGLLSGDRPYIVMELLHGLDLSDLLERRGPLPVDEAVDYVLQASQAIAHAHALGIVHRDLKPSNIFLAKREAGGALVKVLDFGISKVLHRESPRVHALTSTKTVLGSPGYMSPEQLRSSKYVDTRTDIWAFGVLLYELLSGRLPFVGEGLVDIFAAIMEREAPPLERVRPDVSPELAGAVARCLRRKPEDRFPDVGALAAALAPFGPAHARRHVQKIQSIVSAHHPSSRRLRVARSVPFAPSPSGTASTVEGTSAHSPAKLDTLSPTPDAGIALSRTMAHSRITKTGWLRAFAVLGVATVLGVIGGIGGWDAAGSAFLSDPKPPAGLASAATIPMYGLASLAPTPPSEVASDPAPLLTAPPASQGVEPADGDPAETANPREHEPSTPQMAASKRAKPQAPAKHPPPATVGAKPLLSRDRL